MSLHRAAGGMFDSGPPVALFGGFRTQFALMVPTGLRLLHAGIGGSFCYTGSAS